MGTEAPAHLAERLIEMAPAGMSKVFFGCTGSDANDTQVKLVWYYNNALGRPEKKKIISRHRGYHGVTVMSAGLTGLPGVHANFDLPLPMIRHTTAPHRLWEAEPGMSDEEFAQKLADDLEELILREGPETVAAFIAEPIKGAGGVLVPPAGVLRRDPGGPAPLRRPADRRRGDHRLRPPRAWFGCDDFGIVPDLITVAKGLTSGYVPLSACIVSEKVWRVLVDGARTSGVFGHGYTYSSHPLAAAVAMTNLDLIEEEGLVDQAAGRGAFMHAQLREAFADHPLVGEIRGLALIGALEFVADRSPRRSSTAAEGLGAHHPPLPRAGRDHPRPPRLGLDLVRAAVRHLGGRARGDGRAPSARAVDEVAAELRSEGTLS